MLFIGLLLRVTAQGPPFLSDARSRKQLYLAALWSLAFLAVTFFALAIHGSGYDGMEELGRRISSIVFLMAVMWAVTISPKAYTTILAAISIGGVVLAVTVLMGAAHLVFDTDSCRGAGLLINPNGAAYALVLSTALSWKFWRSQALYAWMAAVIATALFFTQSRSGWIAGVLVYLFLFFSNRLWFRLFFVRLIATVSVVAVVFIGASFTDSSIYRCINNALADRFRLAISLVESINESPLAGVKALWYEGSEPEEPAELAMSRSDSERLALATKAFSIIGANPVFGGGIDAMQGVRAHNIMLELAAEHGIVGLLLFPWLLALAARTRGLGNGIAVAAVFVIGMFSHGVLYDRYILLVLALVLSTSGGLPAKKVRPTQDTIRTEPNSG